MTYEAMNEWMSHEFYIFLQICVSNVFEMYHISAWNTYTDEFCTISIIKSWYAKFVMLGVP
jgi:hypothetical protein